MDSLTELHKSKKNKMLICHLILLYKSVSINTFVFFNVHNQ